MRNVFHVTCTARLLQSAKRSVPKKRSHLVRFLPCKILRGRLKRSAQKFIQRPVQKLACLKRFAAQIKHLRGEGSTFKELPQATAIFHPTILRFQTNTRTHGSPKNGRLDCSGLQPCNCSSKHKTLTVSTSHRPSVQLGKDKETS